MINVCLSSQRVKVILVLGVFLGCCQGMIFHTLYDYSLSV